MNTGEYLARIGRAGAHPPTAETLGALQEAHLLSVPFENLDIGSGVPITLDAGAIYDKVVRRRRGGFCYELNGVFHQLLLSLGFRSSMVSARVHDSGTGAFGPEFDHMALIVDVGGKRFLSDVGFGEFSLRPLELSDGGDLHDAAGVFRIEETPGDRMLVSRRRDEPAGGPGAWEPQYEFSDRDRALGEFAGMCRHHQTSPDSHFTQRSVCSLATPSGRITLLPDRFIETRHGIREERSVPDRASWEQLLASRFGMRL